jgi:hypothetical protein
VCLFLMVMKVDARLANAFLPGVAVAEAASLPVTAQGVPAVGIAQAMEGLQLAGPVPRARRFTNSRPGRDPALPEADVGPGSGGRAWRLHSSLAERRVPGSCVSRCETPSTNQVPVGGEGIRGSGPQGLPPPAKPPIIHPLSYPHSHLHPRWPNTPVNHIFDRPDLPNHSNHPDQPRGKK